MSKKIKLQATEAQLNALMEIVDEASAQIGGGDDESHRVRWVKLVDRMLANNGYKRNFN